MLHTFKILLAGICPFKINNRSTRTRCEICRKLTIKAWEERYTAVSDIVLSSVSLALNRFMQILYKGWLNNTSSNRSSQTYLYFIRLLQDSVSNKILFVVLIWRSHLVWFDSLFWLSHLIWYSHLNFLTVSSLVLTRKIDLERLFGIRSCKTDLNTPILLWTQTVVAIITQGFWRSNTAKRQKYSLEQIIRKPLTIFIYCCINHFGNFFDQCNITIA